MRQMRMKDQSDKYNLSTEIIAAYLDGNATPAEVQLVLDAMAHDAHLRELLLVSSHVDTELALLHRKPQYIPMTALAAECGEDNLCCLECEKYVMKGRGITYDEQQMLEDALHHGWLKQEGTALHNVGRHLEKTGLVVTRQYGCSIQNIIDALNHHEDVIVAVDSGKLLHNRNINHVDNADTQFLPDHTVVVIAGDVETDVITLFDPNSPNPTDTYSLAQFASAWADSKNYLVTIKTFDNMKDYQPKPIDVSDVILEEDVTELREAIAENAHDIWAVERMQQGWTYGPERNDELKHNPCMVPYSKLPESEKEYDRQMAMQTIKLMKKLGYDLVKREDTELYDTLLRRLRYSTQTFLCPNCSKHGKKSPVYKHQAFCDVCGHELTDVDWTIYDKF